MAAAETELQVQAHKQDVLIRGALESLRRTAASLEETEHAQTREINILRKMIEPLIDEFEAAQKKKKKPTQTRRWSGFQFVAGSEHPHADTPKHHIDPGHDKHADPRLHIGMTDKAGAETINHIKERVEVGDDLPGLGQSFDGIECP